VKDNPAFARQKITVGPTGADVCGLTGRAMQIAIDALSAGGGGTVEVQEGEYTLIDSVRLRGDIALIGRGQVVLRRPAELAASPLARDADAGQAEIAPVRLEPFRPGMGVCLWDSTGWLYGNLPMAVTAISAGRLTLNDMMLTDRLAERGGRVINYFPLILAEQAERCLVENLTLRGDVADDPALEALWSSGVYIFRSRQCTLRGLRCAGLRGDGICFAHASTDTTVEDCESFRNTHLGIHAGSHSARAAVRRCHIHHNGSDGLYICWGIDHGFFEDNDIHHNGWRLWRSGLSIGHQDTDNVIARNHVYENCKHGVTVRQKTEANGAHRNVFRQNVIENNGQDPATMPAGIRERLEPRELASVGVCVNGITHDVLFEKNVIRETRPIGQQRQKHAFYIGQGVSRLTLLGNDISGHPDASIVDESGAKDNRLQ
jgi:hypothetical protein